MRGKSQLFQPEDFDEHSNNNLFIHKLSRIADRQRYKEEGVKGKRNEQLAFSHATIKPCNIQILKYFTIIVPISMYYDRRTEVG